jgi:aminopeptidase N
MATLVGRFAAIDRLTTDDSRSPYRAWLSALLKPAMQEVGWTSRPGDTDDRRELRASLFAALGETARDPETITMARQLVESVFNGSDSLDSNLLNEAVRVAALGGDTALYEKYLARSAKAVDPEDHYRYLGALPMFSEPSLVRRTMDYTLSAEVRAQDAGLFVARLLSNPDAQSLAWQLLRERWSDIQKKTGPALGSGFLGALGSFCDSRTATEVQQFFAEHKVPEAERTLKQAVERITTCADLATAQSPKLGEWLKR